MLACWFTLLCGLSLPPLELSRHKPATLQPRGAVASPSLDRADAAFEAAVRHLEERALSTSDAPLSAEVPRLLRAAFDADFERLRASERHVANVTCLQPVDPENGQLFDDELINLALKPGRVCADGSCCDACSRVTFPALASAAECASFRAKLDEVMVSSDECPHHNLYLSACTAAGDVRATLQFVRLVERLRRAIAHEYGLRLENLSPSQTFISRITHEAGDDIAARQSIHADECSSACFHYSAVLYLSSQGVDFEGGGFAFTDDPQRAPPGRPQHAAAEPVARAGGSSERERVLSPLSPTAGAAVIFSSGWENMHFVQPVSGGTRFAVPAFFVTSADDEPAGGEGEASRGALDGSLDGARRDEAIADVLWRALMPESEDDFRPLLADWHALMAA